MVLVKPAAHSEPPITGQKIPHKIFHVPYDQVYFEEFIIKTAIEKGQWKTLVNLSEMQSVMCELLLNNTELIQHLRNFDLIVFERFFSCASMVGDLLGIPKVVISAAPNFPEAFFQFNVPCPISYVPSRLTAFTSEMSFTQRLVNFGVHNFFHLVLRVLFAKAGRPLKEKYKIAPEKDFYESLGNVELVLFMADFALEYPQPLLPGLYNIN